MKTIYVAHPYGGEEENKQKVAMDGAQIHGYGYTSLKG